MFIYMEAATGGGGGSTSSWLKQRHYPTTYDTLSMPMIVDWPLVVAALTSSENWRVTFH